MITLACTACQLALRLNGDIDEVDHLVGTKSEWYPDKYPCPRRECGGPMLITDAIASTDLRHLEIHDVNPQEAFQALQGLGMPSERDCNSDLVRDLLTNHKIVSLEMQPISGAKRSVIHSLTLDSGVRIYLASSPAGATVYRIAPLRSVVKDLENGI